MTSGDWIARIKRLVARMVFAPKVNIECGPSLKRLGSEYGGWHFVDLPELHGATIISAGLGEDASFDVEFAREYNAKVVIVDPTPRAIAHHQAIITRAGMPAARQYSSGGQQPIDAYTLDKVSPDQLVLVDKALWVEAAKLKFYLPPDPNHVSHSIVNFQNDYSEDTASIEVEAETLEDILSDYDIEQLELLKLDIEAAEVPVLRQMLEDGLRPVQLLIEFDELIRPSRKARDNYYAIDNRLRSAGYRCLYFDGKSNFLYLRNR